MKKSFTVWQAEWGLEKLFGADGCISGYAIDSGTAGNTSVWAVWQTAALQERREVHGSIQG